MLQEVNNQHPMLIKLTSCLPDDTREMLKWCCVFISFEFASVLMPNINWYVPPKYVSTGFLQCSHQILFTRMWSHMKKIFWDASSTLVPTVPLFFPVLGGCVWGIVIFSWPYCKPCMYWSYSLNSMSCESPALLIMLSSVCSGWQWLFFHVTSCSGSMSFLQQSWDAILQAGLSVCCMPHLQAHLYPPLVVEAAMHEQVL